MSTIATVQEAYEAICAGEFFQVGNKIINPDDIVRFEYGREPVFHLEDGTAVQHNRYLKGSTGDLLAEALSVATRGETQSEQLPPKLYQPSEYTRTSHSFGNFDNAVDMRVLEGRLWMYFHDRNNAVARIEKWEIDGYDVTTRNNKLIDKDVSANTNETSPGDGHVSPDEQFLYVWQENNQFDKWKMSTKGDLNTLSHIGEKISHPTLQQYNHRDLTWINDKTGLAVIGDNIQKFTVDSSYDLFANYTVQQSVSQVTDLNDGAIGHGLGALGTPNVIVFDDGLAGSEIENNDLNNLQPYDSPTSEDPSSSFDTLQIKEGGEKFWFFDGDVYIYEL